MNLEGMVIDFGLAARVGLAVRLVLLLARHALLGFLRRLAARTKGGLHDVLVEALPTLTLLGSLAGGLARCSPAPDSIGTLSGVTGVPDR